MRTWVNSVSQSSIMELILAYWWDCILCCPLEAIWTKSSVTGWQAHLEAGHGSNRGHWEQQSSGLRCHKRWHGVVTPMQCLRSTWAIMATTREQQGCVSYVLPSLHSWSSCQHELWSFLKAKGGGLRDEGDDGKWQEWRSEKSHHIKKSGN